MPHVFQLFRPLLEEFMGIIEIERDTRTEGIDERESPVLDAPLNQLDQMLYLSSVSPRHVSRSRSDGKRNRIDRIFDASGGCALGFHPFRTRRRNLSGRKAIYLIVHHNVGEIDVAPHRMNKMVAADAIPITVATGGDNLELVIGELGAG